MDSLISILYVREKGREKIIEFFVPIYNVEKFFSHVPLAR